MRTLFLDCSMGAAGDMLAAALYELLDEAKKEYFIHTINNLGLSGVTISTEKVLKCGITGTHMKVLINGQEEEADQHHIHDHHHDHDHGYHFDFEEHFKEHHSQEHKHEHHYEHEHGHHIDFEEHFKEHHSQEHGHEHGHHHDDSAHNLVFHHHASMGHITEIIENLPVSANVKTSAKAVYQLIAEAESHVHQKPINQIHFHEVGTMDAVADVVAVSLLMDLLNVDRVIASPVHVGSGHVHCAHGILPVPAPATAFILKDIPIYSSHISGELCTPTGAALLKYFVNDFGKMPVMKVNKIGYGMGKKDFDQANCVRAFLGEKVGQTDQIVELTCNIDDMTPEKLGFAMERLFDAGALEVYTIPVGMKKSRTGFMLCVMGNIDLKEKLINTIFKYTTTLGVRENISQRYTMSRKIVSEETPFGQVRAKISSGYGVERKKYEYEDLAVIAKEKNLSIDEILEIIASAKKA